jgi:arylsulfatase A-like enzyme
MAAEPAKKPNIVYILADDFGYGDAACYNPKSKIPTPNIDRLAKEGMRFTDAHSGSSVCSPTRYGILTGRYAWRTKLRRGVLGPYEAPLIAASRLTVPALLRQNGYHTACIGKWHLGWDWPKTGGQVQLDRAIPGGPTARGFDTYFGTCVPNHPPYAFIHNDRLTAAATDTFPGKDKKLIVNRGGAMVPGWKFDEVLPTLATKAGEYLAERAKDGKRFFLYFPLTSPHEPIAPSARYRGKSGISELADFFIETDAVVGQVLDALDAHELADNTLVIFTCDNGHAKYTGLPALEKAGHEVSGPLRGYKADIYEGGHRVPFIARWPAVIPAGISEDETICHTDLMATCADFLQVKLPDDAGVDSVSLLPLFEGKKVAMPIRGAVVHQAAQGMLAIRHGKWKLIFNGTLEKPFDELYDLASDLGEKENVAVKNPEIVTRLTNLMTAFIAKGRSTPGKQQANDVAVPLRVEPTKKK